MEEWKIINEFQKYEVSNLGNVRNLKTKHILATNLKNGYLLASLQDSSSKTKRRSVHRLVALAFLENEHNKETVNHINGNKLDNKLENLEWATQKENVQHSIKTGLSKVRLCPITQTDLKGNIIRLFSSIKEIEDEFKYDRSLIIRVCKGKGKTAYGFKWFYTNDPKPIIITDVEGKSYMNYKNYIITRDGRIYSKLAKKFLKLVENNNQHLYVTFSKNGSKKNFYISNLVAKVYISNPNNYSAVLHKNGNKKDNRLENLEWIKYHNTKINKPIINI